MTQHYKFALDLLIVHLNIPIEDACEELGLKNEEKEEVIREFYESKNINNN